MKAPEILAKAADLVSGDRAEQHGDMHKHFAHVADLWTAYLGRQLDFALTAQDVPNMMAILKIARTRSGKVNPDDWIDGAGYLGCAGQVATLETRR